MKYLIYILLTLLIVNCSPKYDYHQTQDQRFVAAQGKKKQSTAKKVKIAKKQDKKARKAKGSAKRNKMFEGLDDYFKLKEGNQR